MLFVGWQVSFENRLYKLEPGQYRVDAAYIGPDGRTLGSVNDYQPVSMSMKTVTFSGRVGNSRGGAFLPGTYTVNFYLNGQYFGAKKFDVVADAGGSPYATYPGSQRRDRQHDERRLDVLGQHARPDDRDRHYQRSSQRRQSRDGTETAARSPTASCTANW